MSEKTFKNIEPKDLAYQYLEAHSQASGIPITELLQNEAFRATYAEAISQLSACHSEIVEQGIEAMDMETLERVTGMEESKI